MVRPSVNAVISWSLETSKSDSSTWRVNSPFYCLCFPSDTLISRGIDEKIVK